MRPPAKTAARAWLSLAGMAALLGLLLLVVDPREVLRELRQLPTLVVLAVLLLLLARSAVAEVARWREALRSMGCEVPFLGLLTIYGDFAAPKMLLPFKAGDVGRVAEVVRRFRVGALQAAGSRLLTMGLLVPAAALVLGGCAAVVVGLGPWATLGLMVASLAVAAALAWSLRERAGVTRGAAAGLAFGWALVSVLCDVTAYSLLLWGLTGAWPDARGLTLVAATVLACYAPVSRKGVGIREILLATLGVRWGIAAGEELASVGLAISAAEVATVVLLTVLAGLLRVGGVFRSSVGRET